MPIEASSLPPSRKRIHGRRETGVIVLAIVFAVCMIVVIATDGGNSREQLVALIVAPSDTPTRSSAVAPDIARELTPVVDRAASDRSDDCLEELDELEFVVRDCDPRELRSDDDGQPQSISNGVAPSVGIAAEVEDEVQAVGARSSAHHSSRSRLGRKETPEPETEPKLTWADEIERDPDPRVVTDVGLLEAIKATRLPWRVRDRRSNIEMLLVPPGSFLRGASANDEDAMFDEKPAHLVSISEPFYLGRYEVLESEWNSVERFARAPVATGFPRSEVSFEDVRVWLAYGRGLRLPTEAEWEFACRAGTRGPRYGELHRIAVHGPYAYRAPEPIGTMLANPLGFHDMLGNLREWCSDWFALYDFDGSVVIDPTGPALGTQHVLRGGSFSCRPEYCRASYRYFASSGLNAGFRVARNP